MGLQAGFKGRSHSRQRWPFSGLLLVALLVMSTLLAGTPVQAATVVVTTANDSGAGSLRQALDDAVADDTITFDSALSDTTINLVSTLTLTKNVTIDGSALALPVTLNGQTSVMVMSIPTGVTAVLDSLKIANGVSSVSNRSGGIWNNGGNLTVNRATFDNNSSLPGTWDGGAIYTDISGTLTVSNSTFTNNKARWGSAISTWSGVNTTITNSTFYNNSANAQGAIVISSGTGILRNNTISGNSALDNNAAFSNWGGSVTLSFYNNIMANSTNNSIPTTDCIGMNATFIANEGNLITSNHPSFSCATAAVTTDPNLGPLQNNGGPTMTMALLEGSPAINAGSDANATAADQRGVARPVGGRSDIGAFESAFALETYALVVSKAGIGTGTVASTPAGISCGVDCDETFAVGSIVTLTPTPATGSGFTGWSGACTGSGVCEVTMDAAKNVTATFLPLAAKPIGIYAPATSSTGSYQIAWNIINAANVTYKLYENNGITNTEIYSGPNYKVTVSGRGNGTYNYTVKATIAGYADSAITGPAPTTVTVVCGKIIGIYGPPTSITGKSYQISWNISNTAGVTYKLYEDGGEIYSGPNNKFTINGKTSGTYSYTVQATKAGIDPSAVTAPVSTTIVVGHSSGINGPTSNISGNYNISWNSSVTAGVTYMLYENNGTTNTLAYSGPNNNYTFSGKTNGTYSYTVKATKAGIADSALTAPISTTVFLACGNINGIYVPNSSIVGNSYQVSWNSSSTAGVTYKLYEDDVEIYSGPINSFTVSGKGMGTYSYTVKATKEGIADSALSSAIITTVTDTCENIPGIYGPSTSSNGSYVISWNRSGTDGVTYQLYENTNTLVYTGTNSGFSFSGKPNGTYSYTVKAIKTGGNESALTGPISTTVTIVNAPCGNIYGIYGPTTNISGSYQISWNIVNNSGITYKLYENDVEIYSGPNNKVTLSGKTNGIYNYTVKATKAGMSDSPTRGTVTTTVTLTCGSIIGIYGPTTSTSGYYKISWNRSVTAGVTYELYENNGIANTLVYSGPNNYVTFSDKANGTYSYTVKAIKAGIIDSPTRGTVTTTVTVTCGSIPGISGPTTSTSGNYQISWGMSATAGVTYELYEDNGTANTLIYSGPNNNFNISGKTNGTYSYTVKATKAGRLDSPTRGTVNTAVTVTCGSIAGINAPTNSTGSYTVAWDSSATPSVTYVLEESVDSGSWTEVNPGPVTNSYNFTAKPAGSYSYRVTATKTGYNSSAPRVLATPVTVTP